MRLRSLQASLRTVQGGCLAATWRAPVAVATRDWLRAGIGLDLMGTALAADHPKAADGLTVRTNPRRVQRVACWGFRAYLVWLLQRVLRLGQELPSSPACSCEQVLRGEYRRTCSVQACKVDTARFAAAAALLDGVMREVAGTVCFAAPPALWDSCGRRLTLVDALASAPQARPL